MKMLSSLIVALIIVVGGIFVFQNFSRPSSTNETALVAQPTAIPTVKSFTVEGTSFSFHLKEIKVNQGDTVKVTFVNKNGFHDFTLDEFNVGTKQLPVDQQETVEFVADKKGTFEYYCSVGNHRAQGMVGKLIVE